MKGITLLVVQVLLCISVLVQFSHCATSDSSASASVDGGGSTLLSRLQAQQTNKNRTIEPIRLYGINYNPRQGPDWDPNRCKTRDEIVADLLLFSHITNRIRLLSLIDCNQGEMVLDVVYNELRFVNMTIWLGLWVGPNQTIFELELQQLELMIQKDEIDPTIVTGITVGSEAVFRKDVTATQAVKNQQRTKQLMLQYPKVANVPVGIVDIKDIFQYKPNRIMMEKSDIIAVNVFPFWEKLLPEDSVDYLIQTKMPPFIKLANETYKKDVYYGETGWPSGGYNPFASKASPANETYKKDVYYGETGWPSGGYNPFASKASPANELKYFQDFYCICDRQYHWKYYWFGGIDTAWRTLQDNDPNTVEGHFGLFYANNTLKEIFQTMKLVCPHDDNIEYRFILDQVTMPTIYPLVKPSAGPTNQPSYRPTSIPTAVPVLPPTSTPTVQKTPSPTILPTTRKPDTSGPSTASPVTSAFNTDSPTVSLVVTNTLVPTTDVPFLPTTDSPSTSNVVSPIVASQDTKDLSTVPPSDISTIDGSQLSDVPSASPTASVTSSKPTKRPRTTRPIQTKRPRETKRPTEAPTTPAPIAPEPTRQPLAPTLSPSVPKDTKDNVKTYSPTTNPTIAPITTSPVVNDGSTWKEIRDIKDIFNRNPFPTKSPIMATSRPTIDSTCKGNRVCRLLRIQAPKDLCCPTTDGTFMFCCNPRVVTEYYLTQNEERSMVPSASPMAIDQSEETTEAPTDPLVFFPKPTPNPKSNAREGQSRLTRSTLYCTAIMSTVMLVVVNGLPF